MVSSRSRPGYFAALRRPFIAYALAFLFVIAMAGFSVYQSHLRYEQQARTSARNLAELLAKQIGGAADRIDLALNTVATEVERQYARGGVAPGDVDLFLARQKSFLPDTNGLQVTDARGHIRFGTDLLPGAAIDVSDRDYFQRLRSAPQSTMVMGGPYVGRVSKRWVVVFARRINHPDGSFAGAALAGIDTERFREMLAVPDIGPRSIVALRTGAMGLVARVARTLDPGEAEDRAAPPPLLAALKTAPDYGSFDAASPLDGIERTFSYQRLSQAPLYVVVGLARPDYQAPWWNELFQLMAVVAVLGLVALWLARNAQRAAEREEATSRLLREAVENAAVGLSIFDANRRLVICNEAIRDFFPEYRDVFIPGVSLEHIMRTGVVRGKYPEALADPEAWIAERIRRHQAADGQPFEQTLSDGRRLLIIENRTPSGLVVSNRIDITELSQYRQRLEHLVETRTAELKSALDQLRILVEFSPSAIAMLDDKLHYVAASRRWIDLYGKGHTHVAGKHLYAVTPDIPEPWKAIHRAALAGVADSREEDRWVRQDGSEYWLRWGVQPWIAPSGSVGGIIVSTEDITKRKQAEAALYQEKLFSDDIINSLPGIFYMLDQAGRYVRWNRKFCEVTGYEPEEVAAMQALQTLDQDSAAILRQRIQEAFELGESSVEAILPTKDGRRFAYYFTGRRTTIGGRHYVVGLGIDITERKAAEAKLAEQEAQFRQLSESLPQLVWTCEPGGACNYVSPQWTAYSGLPASAHLGFGWVSSLHPDDRAPTEAAWLAAQEDGSQYDAEYRVRRHDGAYRWFRGRAVPLTDNCGRILKWFGTSTDIHALKEAQEGLLLARERLETALKASSVSAFSQDRELRYTWSYNPALGHSVAEVIGKRDGDLVERPEDAVRTEAIKREVLSTGTGQRQEIVVRHGGEDRFFELVVDPLHDPAGEIAGVTCAALEITERKRNERSLRRHAERQVMLLDITSGLLLTWQTRAALANGVFDRIRAHLDAEVGFYFRADNRNGLLELQASFGIAPEDQDRVSRIRLGDAVCGTAASRREHVVLEASQIEQAEEAALIRGMGIQAYACHPLIATDGTLLGTFSVGSRRRQRFSTEEVDFLRTVTYFMALSLERLQAKMEIQRLNGELECRVQERTAELAAANKELQGFTYAASHDMKGPLGRINSFSTLLERNYGDRLEGDGLLFLNFIRRNAKRLSILLDDLLAHAQVEQSLLSLGPTNLEAVAQQVLDDMEEDVLDAGALVRLDFPRSPVLALADWHGMAQVLRNLLGNALKYSTGATPPRVEIGARLEGTACRLWVRDNGIGFDMAYHDKIFEIFRRLHTYEEFPGSGVGLALAKKAMERMRGRIWAESAPGRGATFTLEVPGAAAEEAARPAETA